MTIKISVRNISVEYVNEERGERHVAVEALTLDIHETEFLCVVGQSGCGKSTLLAAIAGFLRPRSGSITMDDQLITGPGADRGVVFQEYALLPWKNVADNVALGPKFRGATKQERRHIAEKYLKLINLTDAANKYPHELSGGMKQRVAVARTLANEPEVMLMDEPFAAVDAQTRMTLQEELMRISAESNITVMFVTHSVEEAVFLADRVAVLTAGPGRVKTNIPIDIAREKRNWSVMNADSHFLEMRDQIMSEVRIEAAPA